MKAVSFILCFCLSLLIAQPSVALVIPKNTVKKESCCASKNHCKKEKKAEKDCCANGVCNPSLCACCLGALPAGKKTEIGLFSSQQEQFFSYANHFSSSYQSDCFHPPETPLSL